MCAMRPTRIRVFTFASLILLLLLLTMELDYAQGPAYLPNGPAVPTITLNGSGAGTALQEPPPKAPNQQSAWNMELAGHSDLQGRSAYQPIIINENGREIAYVGHHTGSMMNPLTGATEPNGTSLVDVTDPANPMYLSHIPGSAAAGEEAGGAQMVRV